MSRYVLTRAASEDLDEIADFIAEERPSVARRVVSEMRQAMRRLAEFPGMGHVREELAERSIRFWPLYSYLIVYRADSEPLEILRVVHGSRDVRRLLTREADLRR